MQKLVDKNNVETKIQLHSYKRINFESKPIRNQHTNFRIIIAKRIGRYLVIIKIIYSFSLNEKLVYQSRNQTNYAAARYKHTRSIELKYKLCKIMSIRL